MAELRVSCVLKVDRSQPDRQRALAISRVVLRCGARAAVRESGNYRIAPGIAGRGRDGAECRGDSVTLEHAGDCAAQGAERGFAGAEGAGCIIGGDLYKGWDW